MSDTAITAAPSLAGASGPSNQPVSGASAPAAGPPATGAPAPGGPTDGAAFGPAVVIGGSAPPASFSIYTAKGAQAADQPTLRITAPSVDLAGTGLPPSTLYERLGRIVYSIQAAFRGGGLGASYSLGYRLVV